MIADLKPYPKYRETGVSWLGVIPEHWEAKPLRSILRQRNEKNSPVKTEQILSLSIAHGVTLYSHAGRGGNKRKSDMSAYKIAHAGDIVLNSMNVIVGAVGLSRYTGAISPVYYALYPITSDIDILYYDQIFSNSAFQKYLMIYGKGILIIKSESGKFNTIRMKISPDDLKGTSLPLPPPDEQAAIVRFLNHTNQRIERTIRAKRKVIALLNEQKQVITHRAVTRGLDPNVRLKPSGIPWLGEIPDHWETRPLKQLLLRMDYGTSENVRGEGKIRVLTMGHIKDGKVSMPVRGGLYSMPVGLRLETNDLLFNRTNSPDLVGKVGLFRGKIADEVTFASYLVRLRVRTEHNPFWLNHLLNSSQFWTYARSQALVSLHQANLNSKRYGQMILPVPPKEEQDSLTENISSQVNEIEQVISRTEREIDLLREYRTRLIADVVTGKLDVREAAARLQDEVEEIEEVILDDDDVTGEEAVDVE